MKPKPETFKAKLARLRAKRDAIRASIYKRQRAGTPFSVTYKAKR